MKAEKRFTKRRMLSTTVFLTENDRREWLAAASLAGMSRAELLRVALREKTKRILGRRFPVADRSEQAVSA